MHGGDVTVLRNLTVANQGRAAERSQVDVKLGVPRDSQRRGDPARGLDLAGMDLTVADRQREQRVPVLGGDRARGVGVEAPAQEKDGLH